MSDETKVVEADEVQPVALGDGAEAATVEAAPAVEEVSAPAVDVAETEPSPAMPDLGPQDYTRAVVRDMVQATFQCDMALATLFAQRMTEEQRKQFVVADEHGCEEIIASLCNDIDPSNTIANAVVDLVGCPVEQAREIAGKIEAPWGFLLLGTDERVAYLVAQGIEAKMPS